MPPIYGSCRRSAAWILVPRISENPSSGILTKECPLQSTQVHSCPLLSHSILPSNGVRKNPCYSRRVKTMCANALSRSVPSRRYRTLPVCMPFRHRAEQSYYMRVPLPGAPPFRLCNSAPLRQIRSVQNGTFRDWDCICHRHFLRKRTNFFGTSPILASFAESVQNPYKSDHFREHQISTPMTSTTCNFNALSVRISPPRLILLLLLIFSELAQRTAFPTKRAPRVGAKGVW